MWMFPMCETIRARLEKTQEGLSLGCLLLQHKTHLVSWKICCTKKKNKGLVLKSSAASNQALLLNRIGILEMATKLFGKQLLAKSMV